MRRFLLLLLCAVIAPAWACGDDDGTTAMDAGGDAGPPEVIEDLPIEEELSAPCLTGTVEAVQDDRGMWHIYGESIEDVLCAEGYLMARDRLPQMELIRRNVTGRLAQLAGSLSPGLVQTDIASRFAGHTRNAQKIWDDTTPEIRGYLEAFSAGINAYIEPVRNGDIALPRGAGIISPDFLSDWTPLDTLAIARYQSAALSYSPDAEITLTDALAAWDEAFPAASVDPRLAARANGFHDLFPFGPTRDAFTRDGFPNVGTDSGTRALIPPRRRPTSRMALPSRAQLAAARRFTGHLEQSFALFGDESRGSNSWVVHGSVTASGHPILANDPHLQLSSPPLFWMVHLNTERAGGDMDVQGLALAGTPVVLLGYNRTVAWGLTTHNFDVTDVYLETISPGTGGAPDTVELDGSQVPLETITETIELDVGAPMTVTFEVVPHHGLIIPETRTETSALSIRWTGNEPTHEPRAFLELARAQTVEDVEAAYDHFGVGGQNLVAVTRDGHVFWSTQCLLPVRDARALTYDPATRMGVGPAFVLSGTGEHEWTGFLDDRYLPHDLDPARGYIATANNDGVGVSANGNPFDDPHYIGWDFNPGHRMFRISERLDALVGGDGITPDDMKAVQADAQSPYGRLMTPALVAELDRAVEEASTPGTHPDLAAAVLAAGTETMTKLGAMRDRLAAWESFDTPAGVEGTPGADELADSVAATIFNAVLPRLIPLFLADEAEAIGGHTGFAGKSIVNALTRADTMATYDATAGDTVLWDDIRTVEVETRGTQVLAAFVGALAFLEGELGADMAEWRWGRVHTLTLASIVPQTGADPVSIPPSDSTEFPNGFPRHGDNESVDPAGYGILDADDFTYGNGPVQRLVVEMTPDGPLVSNALPGGQAFDPDSPHHADEMERWRKNEAPPMFLDEPAVVEHAERRVRFAP